MGQSVAAADAKSSSLTHQDSSVSQVRAIGSNSAHEWKGQAIRAPHVYIDMNEGYKDKLRLEIWTSGKRVPGLKHAP